MPARFGPRLAGTPKGDIRHLRPNAEAIARMGEGARPALILFPRFGAAAAVRGVGQAEVFMRLTQASTNYVALGRARLRRADRAGDARARRSAIDYPDTETAVGLIADFRRELAA